MIRFDRKQWHCCQISFVCYLNTMKKCILLQCAVMENGKWRERRVHGRGLEGRGEGTCNAWQIAKMYPILAGNGGVKVGSKHP